MPSSTSSSEPGIVRVVPDLPWSAMATVVAVVVVLAAGGWELRCRAAGYAPGLDDTVDLWVENRRAVQPDSTVIIGSSRGLFGLDLDVLAQATGSVRCSSAWSGAAPIRSCAILPMIPRSTAP